MTSENTPFTPPFPGEGAGHHTDSPAPLGPPPVGLPGPAPDAAPASDASAPGFNHSGFSDEIFAKDVTFESLALRNSVLKGLHDAGFERPTKIQAILIPPILAGKDVLGQARTGTGKTGAFGLPLLHLCNKEVPYQALILVPTRELCVQVADEINLLARATPLSACAVFGGQRITQQVESLRHGPQIIVSTPGRLMDMVERRHLHLKNVRFAVLDEVDRMLDIGFRDDIRRILKMCPPHGPGGRQNIFVSATMAPEVERLARSHSHEAEKIIAVVEGPLTNHIVKQWFLPVQGWDKRKLLLHLLTHEEPDLTLVFCRTKRTVDDLSEYLNKKGIDAHAMHGDMMQNRRMRVMEKL
ncbi:MAG: DEAD/DEAH box helicase, partial [Phycisphaerales bacterium]